MNELREAIQVNNAGVRLLLNGDEESLLHFQDAIGIVRGVLLNDLDDAETHSPNDSVQFSIQERPGEILPGLQTDHFYAYDCPILLQPMDDDTDAVSTFHLAQQCDTAQASIVWNLALATHWLGRRTGTDDYLHRASQLYDVLARILETATSNSARLGSGLQCLALNNGAALSHERLDFDESARRFTALGRKLHGSDRHLASFLGPTRVDALRLNVEHSAPPNAAGSA